MNTDYDEGLSYEAFKARGESGEYRPDLDRYFVTGMRQPPVGVPAVPVVETGVAVVSSEPVDGSNNKVKGK